MNKDQTNSENFILKEFIKNLETTANQVQELLVNLNESKIDLASIKTEFKFIVEMVKDLSSIIKDGKDGASILTKIALIEKSMEEIKLYITQDARNYIDISSRLSVLENKISGIYKIIEGYNTKNKEITLAQISGKWKLYIVLVTGVLGIVSTVVTVIINSI